MDTIVASLAYSEASGFVGDITRAGDGTLYFVSKLDLDKAEIGRRVPCGAIETDWMSITAPVSELEVSSDNILYMAASEAGTLADMTARLYRLDLTDPNAFPETLVREPGEMLYSMSAAAGGRVFFVQGPLSGTQSLYYVDGDEVKLAKALGSGRALASAHSANRVLAFIESGSTRKTAIVSMAADGSATLSTYPVASEDNYSLQGLRADSATGFYAFRKIGSGSTATFRLYHSTLIGGLRSQVAEVVGGPLGAMAYAPDGDAMSALLLTPKNGTPMTQVNLGVALSMP